MISRHLLNMYWRQQKTVALSSAEAQLYAMVACSAELLWMQACAKDLGGHVGVDMYADASIALGIVEWRGVGCVCHIKTQALWLQETHLQRRIAFEKVDGSKNLADLLINHVGKKRLDGHMAYLGCVPEDGRGAPVPSLGLELNVLRLSGFELDPATQ